MVVVDAGFAQPETEGPEDQQCRQSGREAERQHAQAGWPPRIDVQARSRVACTRTTAGWLVHAGFVPADQRLIG